MSNHKALYIVFGIVALIVLLALGGGIMGVGVGNLPGSRVLDKSFYESSALSSFAPEEMRQVGTETPNSNRQVIKNAWLDLVVETTDTAVEQIRQLTFGYGGYWESSEVYESSSGGKSANVRIRVPAISLDSVLRDLKNIATKVSREQIQTSDVTEALADLDVRLLNLRAEEEQYREILGRATLVEDVLNVTQRLQETRLGIERLEASRRAMADQVAMSSVSISLTSVSEAQVAGVIWRPLTTAKNAVRGLLTGLAGLGDWLISVLIRLPLLLIKLTLALLVLWAVWKLLRWLKPKFFSPVRVRSSRSKKVTGSPTTS